MASNSLGRRYLKTRSKSWAIYIAGKVSNTNITPNQISILSIISALLAALSLLLLDSIFRWLLALFFIQFRLFCNMLDGLVAIEGGKQSKLGDFYNDLPDRIADVLIIVAFGFAAEQQSLFVISNSNQAWFAATMAVLTAYVRVL